MDDWLPTTDSVAGGAGGVQSRRSGTMVRGGGAAGASRTPIAGGMRYGDPVPPLCRSPPRYSGIGKGRAARDSGVTFVYQTLHLVLHVEPVVLLRDGA